MEVGDLVRFVEHPGNDKEPPSQHPLHGKFGTLIRTRLQAISDDWGSMWIVLVDGRLYKMCYERWMEVVNENI